MALKNREKVITQIRNLLLVLSFGFVAAIVVMFLMLNFYGPQGRYLGKNVLVDPALINTLSYTDNTHKIGMSEKFAFDQMEYSFYNSPKHIWKKINIAIPRYKKFYDLIANDISITEVSEEMMSRFGSGPFATLIIFVKSDRIKENNSQKTIFQEVNFANNSNFYRIELRSSANAGKWAYFEHSEIYQKVQDMFTIGESL